MKTKHQVLLDALLPLTEKDKDRRGICYSVECGIFNNEGTWVTGVVGLMEGLFRKWPEFSGNDFYPVSHPQYPRDPGRAFHDNVGILWEGEYGAARTRLLKWMINELQQVCN